MNTDLHEAVLSGWLPDRPLRSYPALLSTEADALAWARSGGPAGGVVVADYQASPRGRGGLPWSVRWGQGLGCSLVLRPALTSEGEGWLYLAACLGLLDAIGGQGTTLRWPDELRTGEERAAALGIHVEHSEQGRIDWAVVTVLVEEAEPPRGPLLAAVVEGIEQRCGQGADAVVEAYEDRCETVGRRVRARLVPMGPSGVEVVGEALGCRTDGSLSIEVADGRRVAVPPQNLGLLDDAPERSADAADRGSDAAPG